MNRFLSGEGVKPTRLASRVALTPSPLVAFPAAANSFLCLSCRSRLEERSLPENGSTRRDLFSYQQGSGLLIAGLQALLLLLTQDCRGKPALIA